MWENNKRGGGPRPLWRSNTALCVLSALCVLAFGTPLEFLERRWFDLGLKIRELRGQTPPADPRVVLVGIDDEDLVSLHSLEDEYQAAADCIRQASDLGAAVVALDVVYARGTEKLAQPILEAAGKGASVVAAEAVRKGVDGRDVRIRSFPWRKERWLPAGLINVEADPDGSHRTYPLFPAAGRRSEAALGVAAYFAAKGLQPGVDLRQSGTGSVEWEELSEDGTRAVQRRLADGRTRMLNFRGGWARNGGFTRLNLRGLRELHAREMARGGTPLAGRVLFLANASTGVADTGPTPFGPNEPLVLLHATAFNDLVQDSAIFRAPRWADACGIVLLAFLGRLVGLCPRKRWLFVLWGAGLLGTAISSLWLLWNPGILVGAATAGVLWTLGIISELSCRHSDELAQRQHIRSSMGFYFPPRILEDVLANPGSLEPRRVEITVLLTDLRNSTPLAEKLGAEGMLGLLNKIFSIENQAVFRHEGSLEKPVGDQFLAYWGAPDPQPDKARRAVSAAQELITGLGVLGKGLPPEVQALFGYGVSVHSGSALLANIGSAQFYHYGIIGDLINATARIESLTKVYGVRALFTREVLEQLEPRPVSRLIDVVIVKGKSVPVELHEIRHSDNEHHFEQVLGPYREAFELYRAGCFQKAANGFALLAAVDGPSRLLQERCIGFSKEPPRDWAGVHAFESK